MIYNYSFDFKKSVWNSSDKMNDIDNPKFKVIFLGDAGVGKTSIINRRIHGSFDFKVEPTVGASHLLSEVLVEQKNVELCLWDTAGQEQYQSLVPIYIRGANVVVIVGSIVDHQSILNLSKWKEFVMNSETQPCIIALVNKIDINEGYLSNMDDIRNSLSENFENIFFVSARMGDGIEEVFFSIASMALKSIRPAPKEVKVIKSPPNIAEATHQKRCC